MRLLSTETEQFSLHVQEKRNQETNSTSSTSHLIILLHDTPQAAFET